ncbi:DNA polymerase IV [Microbulbifer thermotolerans]|uniref:DNA polymerase IV n=1 Tax=Microbulbifer thermotolerans TaxID=252514 RepID=A0A143HMH7_MICTH|nr:DNA polymerase IV [Microbulbifer thermotolerans]AMX02925.1 DNA polymerase IV [Microbulbifer thermotolerans]MCX2779837.1 DNA polymerase IV [Microbulbifer thermotolerans]MCX2781642.1 DNA polymerase IV [Microbulbifer thermotolerans]MCX2794801.1 DNA polymerase IV [Microbulbifer thermotolerans]MCX2802291.1 DNA polymerase IV [Microbulbifer thermotolerans]
MRKIIHCDCDCFYASVEMRDDPNLRGRPLAVGGASDRRGVISTCNYEARSYGVRSAMPTAQAKKLCPELIVVPGNMNKYREVSRQIRDIFLRYSETIEPLSLDEAYLDVSHSDHCQGSATLMAEAIRRQVREELGITISAGVAPNKFLAKVASDWRKPDGLTVITPDAVDQFVLRLPVAKIHGVGRVTAEKMRRRGIHTCADLRTISLIELTQDYGKFGRRLYELCRGIDERPVNGDGSRKSLSIEHTFSEDLKSLEEWLEQLTGLYMRLLQRMEKLGDRYTISGATVKVKYNDFSIMTQERASHTCRISEFRQLLCQCWHRRPAPIRLLGMGVKLKDLRAEMGPEQLPLPLPEPNAFPA